MASKNQTLAELQVQLSLQSEKMEAGIKQVDRQLRQLDKQTQRSNSVFGKMEKTLTSLAGTLIAAFSVREVAAFTKAAIEAGDAIAKTAEKVGVSAAELQELRFAAKQSGVEANQLDMALQRFARRMGEAAKGTGELYKTTQQLGIEFKNADGTYQSTVQLLEQYAEAIGRASTQQEKLRLAFKAFDSEGAALVNLLSNGSEKMRELREEAVLLGLTLTTGTTKAAEYLNDELNKLSTIALVTLQEKVIQTTAVILKLFGQLGPEGEIALAASYLERFEREYKKALNAGDSDAAENAIELIAKWSQTLYDLKEAYPEVANVINSTTLQPEIDPEKKLKEFKDVLDSIALAEDPFTPYIKQIERFQEAALAGVISTDQLNEAIARITEEAYRALDPIGQFEQKLDDFVADLNPFNDLAEKLGLIDAALRVVTDPAQIERLFELREALEFGDLDTTQIEDFATIAEASVEKIKQATDGFARDFTNNLIDALATGELAFDDFAKSVLETIAKIVLNEIFTRFFSAIASPLLGSIGLGTGTVSALPSPDGVTRGGPEVPQSFMVGTPMFTMPTKSNRSPVTVNVMNYGNDDVEIEERNSGNGIEIDVLIKNTVRNGLADGSFDRVLATSFGSRRLGY